MAAPNTISIDKLVRLIGTPKCPVLVDVRPQGDFEADPHLIPSSIHCTSNELEDRAKAYGGQSAIVICQNGSSVSQGVAAFLRDQGVPAEALEGGFEAWTQARLPLVPVAKLPPVDPRGRTVWVTRARPKIDRIACPWLIRRFVDPHAVFLFVAPSDVVAVAERFGGVPFDIENVFWSHRGDTCTFDTMVEEFGLGIAPLLRLATIVRGADTARRSSHQRLPVYSQHHWASPACMRTICNSSKPGCCFMTPSIVGAATPQKKRIIGPPTGRGVK